MVIKKILITHNIPKFLKNIFNKKTPIYGHARILEAASQLEELRFILSYLIKLIGLK
jgi:hypothetical protein